MAATGQGATQAPQPVHSSRSTSGSGLPPRRGGKRIARTSQKSPQTRHSTPLFGRQVGPMMVDGMSYIEENPALVIIPGLALTAVIFSICLRRLNHFHIVDWL